VSDDNENLEKAAVATAAAAGAEGSGFISQSIKGVKVALETKKLAMAAYALFFGVTVGTATMSADGTAEEAVQNKVDEIVAAEVERREVLEETITTLTNKVTILEEQVEQHKMGLTNQQAELTMHEHDNSGIVALIDLSKETVGPHAHEFIPHSHQVPEHAHPTDPVMKAWLEKNRSHSHDELHEHEATPIVIDEGNAEKYKHKNPRHDSCAKSCHLPD
jgi:hypothetical protein